MVRSRRMPACVGSRFGASGPVQLAIKPMSLKGGDQRIDLGREAREVVVQGALRERRADIGERIGHHGARGRRQGRELRGLRRGRDTEETHQPIDRIGHQDGVDARTRSPPRRSSGRSGHRVAGAVEDESLPRPGQPALDSLVDHLVMTAAGPVTTCARRRWSVLGNAEPVTTERRSGQPREKPWSRRGLATAEPGRRRPRPYRWPGRTSPGRDPHLQGGAGNFRRGDHQAPDGRHCVQRIGIGVDRHIPLSVGCPRFLELGIGGKRGRHGVASRVVSSGSESRCWAGEPLDHGSARCRCR